MRECRVIRKKSERNKRLAEKIQNTGMKKKCHKKMTCQGLGRFSNYFQQITLLRIGVTMNNLRLRQEFTRCLVTAAASGVYM